MRSGQFLHNLSPSYFYHWAPFGISNWLGLRKQLLRFLECLTPTHIQSTPTKIKAILDVSSFTSTHFVCIINFILKQNLQNIIVKWRSISILPNKIFHVILFITVNKRNYFAKILTIYFLKTTWPNLKNHVLYMSVL